MNLKHQFAIVLAISLAGATSKADKKDVFMMDPHGRFDAQAINYVNHGIELSQKGDMKGARFCFDKAIQIDKTMWPAYLDRAGLSLAAGQPKAALADCNIASRLRPDFYRTFTLRAEIYRNLGRCQDALNDLNKILSFHSYAEVNAIALNERALLRMSCRDGSIHDLKQALADARQACNLDRGKARYMGTLALAYAENGDYENAIKYEERAIQSGKYTEQELQQAKRRLAEYQQHHRP